MPDPRLFKLENGETFSGLNLSEYAKFWETLESEVGLDFNTYIESASVSAAMVLRVALGLSASGAMITTIVDDCRAGALAAATLRVLTNAGANTSLLSLNTLENISPEFEKQLKLADASGVQLAVIQQDELGPTVEHIGNCHAVILGLFNGPSMSAPLMSEILKEINELQTPVHVIEAPPGINVESGMREAAPLFAATTISLGMPLKGLAEGKEFCGRIYLCDISVPRTIYSELAPNLLGLFESQPVNQIFAS